MRAIVVATGARIPEWARARLPADALVVGADGGIDAAHALGLTVDLAIGDFDSVTAEGLARAEAGGARVERHPTAKDATDLELALDATIALGARDVVVLAAGGGRLDHLLALVSVITAPCREGVRVTGWFDATYVAVITPGTPMRLQGRPGDLVTLLPVHGTARGVRTEGLVYALDDDDLAGGTSRGVSNVLVDTVAHVSIATGTLLAVLPGDSEEGTTP